MSLYGVIYCTYIANYILLIYKLFSLEIALYYTYKKLIVVGQSDNIFCYCNKCIYLIYQLLQINNDYLSRLTIY